MVITASQIEQEVFSIEGIKVLFVTRPDTPMPLSYKAHYPTGMKASATLGDLLIRLYELTGSNRVFVIHPLLLAHLPNRAKTLGELRATDTTGRTRKEVHTVYEPVKHQAVTAPQLSMGRGFRSAQSY